MCFLVLRKKDSDRIMLLPIIILFVVSRFIIVSAEELNTTSNRNEQLGDDEVIDVENGKFDEVKDKENEKYVEVKDVENGKHDEVKDVENGTIFCGLPPTIEGTIPSHLKSYPVGTRINFQCDFGYVGRGSSSFWSVCVYDEVTGKANWTNPNVECIPRSCGDPGFIVNAHRIGNLFTFPHKVEFKCDEGFRLQGLAFRYCQSSGVWSGRLPSCERIFCDRPSHIENGRVKYDSLEYGSVLRYECDKGFILKEYQTRYCDETGTWSHNDPVCNEVRCIIPEAPTNGTVRLSGEPKVNGLALFACNMGKSLIGTAVAKCLETGEWTFPPPKCKSSCVLPGVNNGKIGRHETVYTRGRSYQKFVEHGVGTVVKHGETMTLLCNDGYTVTELSQPLEENSRSPGEIACEDGKWSKDLQCKSQSCLGEPPPIENGYPVVGKRTHLYVIYYNCDENYVKTKYGHVECFFGTWRGNTPVCEDGRCYFTQFNDDPGLLLPNAQFIKNSKTFPIDCKEGYRKVASRGETISCEKGKWKVPERTCEEENCQEEPPRVNNGKAKFGNRVPNSEVQYECEDQFKLTGHSSVRCVAGKWTGQTPSCVMETNFHSTSATAATEPQMSITQFTQSSQREATTALNHFSAFTPKTLIASEESTPGEPESCFCVYNHQDAALEALVGSTVLQKGSLVKKGDTAVFDCIDGRRSLTWKNGLRLISHTKMVCDVCQIWNANDLPYCNPDQRGDSYIILNKKMKLLPGGVIKVKPKMPMNITCGTMEVGYASWHPVLPRDSQLKLHYKSRFDGESKMTWYKSFLEVEFQPGFVGEYQCFITAENGYTYRRATLKVQVSEIRCPFLDGGEIFNVVYSGDRKPKSTARFSCKDFNLKIAGTDTITCSENGDWVGSQLSCVESEIRCPDINKTEFFVVYSDHRKPKSTARFFCKDSNLDIAGTDTLTCSENGLWIGNQPSCVGSLGESEIRCPLIDVGETFKVVYSGDLKPKSTVRFSCRDSNLQISGTDTLTCAENGHWSGSHPSCVGSFGESEIRCPLIDEEEKFNVVYSDDRKPKSTVRFSCRDSNLKIASTDTLTCSENGHWFGSHPSCVESNIRCPYIADREVYKIIYTGDRKPMSAAAFSCIDSNLDISGTDTLICSETGRWIGDEPSCVESNIRCPFIADREVFKIIYTRDRKPKSAAVFSCIDSNLNISGTDTLICSETGRWIGDEPSCVAPGCRIQELADSLPDNVIPAEVGVNGDLQPIFSELPLLCTANRVLLGSIKATCDQQGKWKYGKLRCVRGCILNMDNSPSQVIINPKKQHFSVGEFASFSCPDGYSLNSETVRVVCMGSSWSNPFPDCVKDEVGTKITEENKQI